MAPEQTGPTGPTPLAREPAMDLQAMIDRGVTAFQAGDYETAVAVFRSYLSHDPDNAEVWWNIARAYELSGQWSAASDAYGHYNSLEADPARRAEGEAKKALTDSHLGGGDTQKASMSWLGMAALLGLGFVGYRTLIAPRT